MAQLLPSRPDDQHNLKAQNLEVFAQIAEGISESTWMFQLRRSDYSRWFRDAIRDSYLADQAERIERRMDLTPSETRLLSLELIRARSTLPE
jgi:hypothetical protein